MEGSPRLTLGLSWPTLAGIILLVVSMLVWAVGCAPSGSPRVAFTKDVPIEVLVGAGDNPRLRDVDVQVEVWYDQRSATDMESSARQRLEDLLDAEVSVDGLDALGTDGD